MRRVWNKTQDQIACEWDSIAAMRSEQIRTGKDISYEHVLTPAVLRLTEGCDYSTVLDVGCGCGLLTAKLAGRAKSITGIDISATSIRLARHHCHDYTNITFLDGAIEDLTSDGERNLFSLAVANMSLMAILKLDAALGSLSQLVRPGGHLAFTITHPCFWPQYWKYEKEWFRYQEECVIEAPFHISLDTTDRFVTTHIHRPLERYVSELTKAKFHICRVIEPMPPPEIELMYPQPWTYPRFLAVLCVRTE
jgi:predicted TPR repeat methyltransferase